MFDMKHSTKNWIGTSLVILAINVTVFLFRDSFDLTILFWLVILTPVAWLVLYFLTELLYRSHTNRNNQQS